MAFWPELYFVREDAINFSERWVHATKSRFRFLDLQDAALSSVCYTEKPTGIASQSISAITPERTSRLCDLIQGWFVF
jgi:hypothetical protein